MIDVGIIAAPRKVNYLSESLDSFFREFPDSHPHIFCEPNFPPFFNQQRVTRHFNAQKLGCFFNWMGCVKYLLEHGTSEWIMTCEDDIYWRPGSGEIVRKYLGMELTNNVGLFTPYVSYPNGCSRVERDKDHGFITLQLTEQISLCGTLACIFRRDTLVKILDHPIVKDEVEGFYLDYTIGEAIRLMRLDVIGYIPTLVLHLGVESAVLTAGLDDWMINSKARLPYDPAYWTDV